MARGAEWFLRLVCGLIGERAVPLRSIATKAKAVTCAGRWQESDAATNKPRQPRAMARGGVLCWQAVPTGSRLLGDDFDHRGRLVQAAVRHRRAHGFSAMISIIGGVASASCCPSPPGSRLLGDDFDHRGRLVQAAVRHRQAHDFSAMISIIGVG